MTDDEMRLAPFEVRLVCTAGGAHKRRVLAEMLFTPARPDMGAEYAKAQWGLFEQRWRDGRQVIGQARHEAGNFVVRCRSCRRNYRIPDREFWEILETHRAQGAREIDLC